MTPEGSAVVDVVNGILPRFIPSSMPNGNAAVDTVDGEIGVLPQYIPWSKGGKS